MADDLDVLSLLPEGVFRGVVFPVVDMSSGFDHDQAQHKYQYRDGAFVENTGANPQWFKFTIPFRNGLVGQTTQLYPSRWRDFIEAFADKSTGNLTHPEQGPVNVKPKSISTKWDPSKRDGVDVEAEFIQTLTSADEDILLFGDASPAAQAEAAARELGNHIDVLAIDFALPGEFSPSLLDTIKQINGLASQFQLGLGNIASQIEGVLTALDELIGNLQIKDNPNTQAAIDAATRCFNAMVRVAETVTAGSRDVTQVTIERDSTLSAAAAALGQKLPDLLKLNPQLATKTSVTAGTAVLVYVLWPQITIKSAQ